MVFIAGLQILFLSADIIAQTKTKTTVFKKGKTVRTKKVKQKMFLQKNKELPQGNWGGQGISLKIEENGANLQFDCAEAEIQGKIIINDKGFFSINGEYIRNGPGPIRLNMPSRRQNALFEGKISGNIITLSVTLTDSKDKIGDFKVKLDASPVIRRCL